VIRPWRKACTLGVPVPPHDAAEEKTELALVFDDAEFQPDLDAAPNGIAAPALPPRPSRLPGPSRPPRSVSRHEPRVRPARHHDPLRRDPAARPRECSPACASSATRTSGRPRSTAPTGSLPSPGRRLGAGAESRRGHHPGIHRGPHCWPRAWPPWRTPPRALRLRAGRLLRGHRRQLERMAFENQFRRMRDTLHFLRMAFSGEKVTEEFETFRVKGFRLAGSRAASPIYLAALRPGMLHLAGREADGRSSTGSARGRGHLGGRSREGAEGRPEIVARSSSSSRRMRAWPGRSAGG